VSHDGTVRRWDDYAGKEYSQWKLKNAHNQDKNSLKPTTALSPLRPPRGPAPRANAKAGSPSPDKARSPRAKGRSVGPSVCAEMTSMRLLQTLRLAMTGHDDGT
jgi:hypothetical protein